MSDSFHTLAAPVHVETAKVKGSRFIGEAFPAADEAAAEAHLAAVRKREHAATHHCSAWRLGPDGAAWRYSDDGEPSGSAGAPILRQIEGRGLTDVAVVVTRYYGGTKLGVGGLVRAYGDAAAAALDAASVKEIILRDRLRLRFAYDDTSPAMHVIGQFDAPIVDTAYSEITELTVAVRRSQVDALQAAFVEALSGRGEVI